MSDEEIQGPGFGIKLNIWFPPFYLLLFLYAVVQRLIFLKYSICNHEAPATSYLIIL